MTDDQTTKEAKVIEHSSIPAALAHAMLEYEPLKKTEKVDYPSKKGGRVQYSYAGLPSVRGATDKYLNKHGLVVTDRTEKRENREYLISTLRHAFSEEIHETELEISINSGDMKDLGANITYARRYNYCNLTGRTAEEDNDAREVQRPKPRQQDKQPQPSDKKTKTPLEKLKAKYYSILSASDIFNKDDKAKHAWQSLAVPGKPSSTQWNEAETKKAIDLIEWRLEVGALSDDLLEYITTKAKSVKGLGKQFFVVMGVEKLTEVKDVKHWKIGMASAQLSIKHSLEAALDMGKVFIRADETEGLFDKIKQAIGVEKMSTMSADQVKVWVSSFRSACNQFNTENPDNKMDIEKLLKGEEG